jgi:hypothetical protein
MSPWGSLYWQAATNVDRVSGTVACVGGYFSYGLSGVGLCVMEYAQDATQLWRHPGQGWALLGHNLCVLRRI